jgi:hypothetical protein
MVLSVRLARLSTGLAFLVMGTVAQGQDLSTAARYLPDSASPFGEAKLQAVETATVAMPILAFTPSAGDARDFDKYYAFQRPETDFATAYADIVECDGYARGLQSGVAFQQTPYMYAGTMAGALGGVIGNVMAQAIFGSAEKRRLRRVNMRTCMNFKGYDRYGLPKDLWVKFNFEEGLSGVPDDKRRMYLKQQALVASSAQLQGKALGL